MLKNLVIWLVIGLVLMTVFNQFNTRQAAQAPMEYSQFLEEVKSGRISKVTIEGRQLKAQTVDGKRVTSYSPGDIWLVSDLLKYGVKVEAKPEEEPSLLMNIFVSWFPMLLLIGVWIFFMRQMQGGGRGGAFSFGKSRARMMDESTNTVTFADVAGCEEAKEEVAELVDFLRDPSKFQKLGGRIPRGVLMVGAPGTGKTLLARAIAGEAKVPFFSISGSDFVEMFVGVGAARVPLRPAGGGAAARHPRPRRDPQGPHAQGAPRARRQARHHRARHAGLLGRRSCEHRERGGPVRGAREQAPGRHGRLRARQGQDHHGRRAPLDGDARGGAPQHRVPRVRPRRRRAPAAEDRPGAQGDDHPARPRARRHDAAARDRPLQP